MPFGVNKRPKISLFKQSCSTPHQIHGPPLEKLILLPWVSHGCNGQGESSNKFLCDVLSKIVATSRFDWSTKLHARLWAFWSSYKVTTQQTPFKLVCRQEVVILIEFLVPSLCVAVQKRWDFDLLPSDLKNLVRLIET